MMDLKWSFLVVSAGKPSASGKRACAPNTESVPVPVRSALDLPLSSTSRSRSRYWSIEINAFDCVILTCHSLNASQKLPTPRRGWLSPTRGEEDYCHGGLQVGGHFPTTRKCTIPNQPHTTHPQEKVLQ